MASIPAAGLDEMIEEATVDCYNDSEQVCALFTKLEEELAIPFLTTVLGVTVVVSAVDLTADDQIVAVCTRDRAKQRIRLLDLPLPTTPVGGAEWIEAYRRWSKQTGKA